MENKFKRFLSLALALVMVIGMMPVQAFADEGESDEPQTHLEGCILGETHEGECQTKVAKTHVDGCTLDEDHEGECQTKVAKTHVDGCTLDETHEGECQTEAAKTHVEGCILDANHEGDCQTEAAKTHVEGCILDANHEGDCQTEVAKTHVEGCTLDEDHEGECQTEEPGYCTKTEGCILEEGHEDECLVEAPCEKTEGCVLMNGHPGECVSDWDSYDEDADTDFTDATGDESGEGWTWTQNTKTLTLSNAAITETVELPENATIVATKGTENSIIVTGDAPVTTSGDLTINGTGALTISRDVVDENSHTIVGAESITVVGTELTTYGFAGLSARHVNISNAKVDITGYGHAIYYKGTTGSTSVTLNNVSGSFVSEADCAIELYMEYNSNNSANNKDAAYVSIANCNGLTINGELTRTDKDNTSGHRSAIWVYTRDAETDAYVEIKNSDVDLNGSGGGISVDSHSDNSASDDASAAWVEITDSTVDIESATYTWAAIFVNNNGTGEKATADVTIKDSTVSSKAVHVGIMTSTKNAASTVNIAGSNVTLGGDAAGIRVKAISSDAADAVVTNSTINVNGEMGMVIDEMDNGTSSDATDESLDADSEVNGTKTEGPSGTGTEADPYQIGDLVDLKWFRDSVNAGKDYSGKYVELTADINLNSEAWTPIGTKDAPFKGTFDGGNHTISNLVVNGGENAGFFGYITSAKINNLTINNATVTGTDCVGAVVGQGYASTYIDSCHVSGSIKIEGQTNVGGIVGKYYARVTNSSVIGNGTATSYVKGTYTAADLEGDNVGGIMGHGGESNNFVDNTVKNITISGTRKIGGIVGTTNRGTNVTGCTVENVTIKTTATADYATSKSDSMGLGGLIGHYYGDSTGGEISGNTISTVTFSIPEGVTAEAGAIVGNDRTNVGNEPTGVTFSDNTATNVTGTTNAYLMPAAVAQIGTTGYASLQDAINAADGKTVKLLANIELTETLTIAAGKTVTLDLNGKTIRQTKEQTDGYQMILNDGSLTITDSSEAQSGKISYTDTGNGGEYISDTIYNRGTLVIKGGTIENLSYQTVATNGYPHAVDNDSRHRDTSVTINGGTIYCENYSAIRMFCTSTSYKADLVINDGTIKGAVDMQNSSKTVANLGSLTINGGTFRTTKNANNIRFANWNSDATTYGITASIKGGSFNGGITTQYVPAAANWNSKIITGGTFSTDVSDYVAEGYKLVENDGTYGVEEAKLSGTGTESDPYLINNVEDLILFRDSVNAEETTYNASGVYVALGADIDMAGTDWSVNIGDDCNATFDGIFDGKNHTIRNLTSTETAQKGDGYVCTGLFGAIYGDAVIKNLTIENANIDAGDFTGNNVGVAVGFVHSGTGSIENVNVCGTVKINAPGVYGVGAIVGYAYQSKLKIKNCSVIGATIKASSGAGAIIGYSGGSVTVQDCKVSDLFIEGNGLVGGIAGTAHGTCKFDACTVKNVQLTTTKAQWINSSAIVVGSLSSDGLTVSNTTYENVKANNQTIDRIVGSTYIEKPTDVVPAVQAKIGNAYYLTLQTAIAAAKAGDTVTVIADITLNAGVTVPEGKTVTLDLNGKTVSMSVAATTTSALITNNGTLTIKDSGENGKLTYVSSTVSTSYSTSTIINNGTLTVESGTIENTSARGGAPYAIDNHNTLTVKGGEITATNTTAIRQVQSGSGVNTVTVTGGTISGGYAGLQVHVMSNGKETTTKITGGEFKGTYAFYTTFYKITDSSNTKIEVSGGTFDGDVCLYNENAGSVAKPFVASITDGTFNGGVYVYTYSADGKYVYLPVISGGTYSEDVYYNCADGYVAVKGDNTWAVREANYVAQVGETKYESLQDAIDAAQNGETVKLLANIELTEGVTVPAGKIVTLDLNGKKISGTSSESTSYALITNKGDLTITGNGKITYEYTGASSNYSFTWGNYTIANSGKLTVNGGTIENTTNLTGHMYSAIDNYSGATTVINGGTVSCPNYVAIRLMATSTTAENSVTINDGTINGKYTLWPQNASNDSAVPNKATLAINGGTITATEGGVALYVSELCDTIVITKANAVEITAPDGYKWDNGKLTAVTYVAQIGETKYETVLDAINAAIETGASEVKILTSTREVMPDDVEIIVNNDLTITADEAVEVKFYNNSTNYDFVFNSNNNNTITIGKNVTFQLEDRIIWLGYYGNNVDVVVEGVLAGYQIWHGADTKVTSTGTLKSTGEALVLRRGATLTVDGGNVNASYFSILSGNIDADNATITSGPIWIGNTGSYDNEGGVSIDLNGTNWTSTGNIKMASEKTAEIKLTNSTLSATGTEHGASQMDANSSITVSADSELNLKTLTGAGKIVIDATNMTAGTVTTISGDASGFTGTIEVVNNDALKASVDENGKIVLVEKVYVAQIGETKYESLQEAINVGGEIKLLADITTSETYTIADGKSITLDMNGKKITATDGKATGSYELFYNYGELKVTGNGTIELTATTDRDWSAASSIFLNHGGELTIENGTFTHKGGTDMAFVVDNNGNSYGDATANINGGTLTSTYVGIRNYMDTYGANGGGNGKTTLNISGGSITGTGKNAVWAQSASKGAKSAIKITGGTLIGDSNKGALTVETDSNDEITVAVSGGIFSSPVAEEYWAEGYAALPDLNGNYVVGEKPTATVNNLGSLTVEAGKYTALSGGNYVDMPLTFVMQFLADQDAEDMETSPFADWYGDFVLTFTGIEGDSFTADGCYLAGYYGDFGWVKVPVDGMTIEDGVRYPVMLGVGMGQKYDYICESVKDFRCALYLTPEILAANPDLEVSLELSVVDNSKGDKAALDALADTENVQYHQVGETKYDADDFKQASGKIAYRAYINDATDREAVQVDLLNVYAKESVKIVLKDANDNDLIETTLKAGGVDADSLTVNIVLWGTASGSWDTAIKAEKLTVANIPATIELWIDGELVETYENALGAGTNVDQTANYVALDCVYKEAKIGDTYYATLAEAIEAAQSGEIVTLLADIELTEGVTVPAGKTVTLDLNGKTISGTSSESTSYALITNKGDLTIKGDGKITYQYTGASSNYSFTWGNYTIANSGKLTVESGTIENTTDLTGHMYSAIDNYSGATTVINGGTVSCPNYVAIRLMAASKTTDNTVEINGGTISGKYTLWPQNASDNSAILNKATLTINGGTITATEGGVALYVSELCNTIVITKADAVELAAPAGYKWDNNGKLTAVTYVAQIGETKYESLQEAITVANAGDTIELLADVTEMPESEVGKALTIKVGDYDLWLTNKLSALKAIAADGYAVKNNNDGTYTFEKVSTAATGEARIGNVIYETLEDAIEAANAGDNINILMDITDAPDVSINKALTIVVNGHTLWADTAAEALGEIVVDDYELTDVMNLGMIFAITEELQETEPVAKIGNVTYTTVEVALRAAKSGETVVMIADSDESDTRLYLYDQVKLNLGTYDLCAKSIEAEEGCQVYGTAYVADGDYAQIFAERLKLGTAAYKDTDGYSYLPIITSSSEENPVITYAFTRARVNNNDTLYKLTVTDNEIDFNFSQTFTGAVRTGMLMQKGATPLGLEIQIILKWTNDQGQANQTFKYNDNTIMNVSAQTSNYYKFKLTEYEELGINPETLEVYAVIASTTGVEAVGTRHFGKEA